MLNWPRAVLRQATQCSWPNLVIIDHGRGPLAALLLAERTKTAKRLIGTSHPGLTTLTNNVLWSLLLQSRKTTLQTPACPPCRLRHFAKPKDYSVGPHALLTLSRMVETSKRRLCATSVPILVAGVTQHPLPYCPARHTHDSLQETFMMPHHHRRDCFDTLHRRQTAAFLFAFCRRQSCLPTRVSSIPTRPRQIANSATVRESVGRQAAAAEFRENNRDNPFLAELRLFAGLAH